MFEPIGGSAPYTGLNVVNPWHASALQHDAGQFGETKAAERVENAIKTVCSTHLKSMAAGKMGYTTEEVGDLVVKYCKSFLSPKAQLSVGPLSLFFLEERPRAGTPFCLRV